MDRFMKDDSPIEAVLAEWHAAEQAGVFLPTRFPISAFSKPRHLFVWIPTAVAAMLALVFSGWALFSQARKPMGEAVAIASCLTGPDRIVAVFCQSFDFDHDGDVDLFDVSRAQLESQVR